MNRWKRPLSKGCVNVSRMRERDCALSITGSVLSFFSRAWDERRKDHLSWTVYLTRGVGDRCLEEFLGDTSLKNSEHLERRGLFLQRGSNLLCCRSGKRS